MNKQRFLVAVLLVSLATASSPHITYSSADPPPESAPNETRVGAVQGSAGLPTTPDWTAEGDRDWVNFGQEIAAAGDVDGDGYSDVIIATDDWSNGQDFEGGVFVFHGGPSGLSAVPYWTAESNQEWADFGASIDTAGDVNGDGYADVIVGCPYCENGEDDEGAVFVWYGSPAPDGLGPAGTTANADWMIEGNMEDMRLGRAVSTAGDVNGDGYDDVIIGNSEYLPLPHGNQEGRVDVYYGSASGLSDSPDWSTSGVHDVGRLGWRVGTLGDINNDGYSDVFVVEAKDSVPGYEQASSYRIFHGSASGLPLTGPDVVEIIPEDNAAPQLATAGDVNGDDFSDAIVGIANRDFGEEDEGVAYVLHGGPGGVDPAAVDWDVECNQVDCHLGVDVNTAGDVTCDGYDDVLVGATGYDNGFQDEGAAFLWYGSKDGLPPDSTLGNADWMVEGGQDEAYMGPVAPAGDVNGDGYPDVIVGAVWYDAGQEDEGAVFGYYGEPTACSVGGDVNGDGSVDVRDRRAVNKHWRTKAGDPGWDASYDLNGDGVIDVGDLMIVAESWGEACLPHGCAGIRGRAYYMYAAAASLELKLWFHDGVDWWSRRDTITGPEGHYFFSGVPSLSTALAQKYRVQFGPQTSYPDYLYYWCTPLITSYKTGEGVVLDNFDVADVSLVSPPSPSTLALPVTFTWEQRVTDLAPDSYRWGLYDPETGKRWRTSSLGVFGSFTLQNLPTGAEYGKEYWWEVWVFNGPDSFGLSQYYRRITFSPGSAQSSGGSRAPLPVDEDLGLIEGGGPVRLEGK